MSKLTAEERKEISGKEYAFPRQKKEPLENAEHVRNAVARFNKVEGVSEEEKDAAWKRIQAAAKKFNVELNESSRRELTPSHAKKAKAS